MIRFFLPLLLWCAHAQAEYLTLEQFDATHPEQPAIAASFRERITKPGEGFAGKNELVKIAVVHPSAQGSDFWNRAVCAMGARLNEHNISYRLDIYTSERKEVRKQIAQLQEALQKNPDYLLFHLDSVRHQAAIEQMLDRSRPKIILQNITTPLGEWKKQPFFYVGFDHAAGARLLAKRLIELTDGEGKYAVIYGLEGYVARMRGDSFTDYVSKNSRLKLAAAYYTQADGESAKRVTAEILEKHPDIRFIYACATDVALGAAEAIAQKGKTGKVLVNGWGGGDAELNALQKGRLDLTLMRINDDHGAAIAEAIALDLNGQQAAVPQVFSGDMVLVEKEIPLNELERLRAHAFRYSGR